MANDLTKEGIIVQVIEIGPQMYKWAMRKGDDEPFMYSNGVFAKAIHAEAHARQIIIRANKKIAFVEAVSEPEKRT